MLTIAATSREFGLPVSTINSAIEAGLITVYHEQGKARQIDEQSEQFQSWLQARMQQHRVKGATVLVAELAMYASRHCIRVPGNVPTRYAITQPLDVLFQILEAAMDDLDFAQAASVDQIASLTKRSMTVAEEYVGLFYRLIGGNQANRDDVMSLLRKQQTLQSAYLILFREGIGSQKPPSDS